jgi:MarR family transcriptional regulator, lower aerobic nicotinate degradation pathway regulator
MDGGQDDPRDGCVAATHEAEPQGDGRDPDAIAADDFLDAFESLTLAIRRARGASQDAEDALSLSQYALIRALAGRDAARVSELAGDAEITPSTATRILDVLERRAMVRRSRVEADRRRVTVTLTETGRAALSRQDAWLRGRQRAFYASLPAAERELAAGLLLRMARLIDELAAGPDAA